MKISRLGGKNTYYTDSITILRIEGENRLIEIIYLITRIIKHEKYKVFK